MPKRKREKSPNNTADLFAHWDEPTHLLDQKCYDLIQQNKNMLIPWFLMSCYAYYHRNVSILSDALFDQICTQLEVNWEDIQHRHKSLIIRTGSSIKATAFQLREEDYPQIVKYATLQLIRSTL